MRKFQENCKQNVDIKKFGNSARKLKPAAKLSIKVLLYLISYPILSPLCEGLYVKHRPLSLSDSILD